MKTLQVICVCAGAAIPAIGAVPAGGKPIEVKGTIEAVTVYRGQALVTRSVEADAPRGAVELVVTELPTQIVPESLYAGADGRTQVRAVRYRTRAVQEEPRDEVRALDKEIEAVGQQLRQNQALQKLQQEKTAYLGNLEAFTATKSKEDMNKSALNVEAVKGLTEFLFQQRTTLAKDTLEMAEKALELQETLALLQRKRGELTKASSRTAREAVLVLDSPAGGKVKVRLHYLVGGATWSPTYNLRSSRQGNGVGLEYNALVQQMSGEDWQDVAVTLSTASPSMVAEAPILTPLWVTLLAEPQTVLKGATLYGGQRTAEENLKKALQQRGRRSEALDRDWDVNVWANRLQYMDLVAGRDALLAGRDLGAPAEALSVSYALKGTLSIPSRSDQQMIQIESLRLEGAFSYVATPMLTPYVYQNAEIVNTSDVALLAGPTHAYLDGQFAGTGQVPMVAKGQRFTIGFGVDPQLRAARELADKTDRVQGGNRELTFRYRLLIDNYKDRPVKVRLMDRLPDPRGADIRVTLTDPADPLSEDKLYLRTLRKMGILRWEIDVPARASGASARAVEFEFKLEFDRKMRVGEPTATQLERQKMEFRQQLDAIQRAG